MNPTGGATGHAVLRSIIGGGGGRNRGIGPSTIGVSIGAGGMYIGGGGYVGDAPAREVPFPTGFRYTSTELGRGLGVG